MKKTIIYSVIALLVLMVLGRHFRPSTNETEFDLDAFGELPVQEGGRIKPIDSIARNTLLVLAKQQKVKTPEGVTLSPLEWFMDLSFKPELADTYRVFKIEFPDDLGIEGLAQEGQRHYSFNDLSPHFAEIQSLFEKINPEPKQREPYEQQLAKLYNGLNRYNSVMHSLHPIGDGERLDKLVDEYATYTSMIGPGLDALRKQQTGEDYDAELLRAFIDFGEDYMRLSGTAHLRVIPPVPPADHMADWKNIGLELLDAMQGKGISPYVMNYASLTMAYRSGDAKMFNQTVSEMRERFKAEFPESVDRVHFEYTINGMQLYSLTMQLYVLVFFIVCISWLRWPQELSKAALIILISSFLLHTFALISRMYIQDRYGVFVTNLYSSAVFVGWGSVLLGIILEIFFKNGIGAGMASLVGFCTLIIAHHLSMTGDTLEMMRAVLDSNFWLATHVTVITFGYSAMFFAGALAIIFILMGLL
ncbi:MAG: hypothetical protein ACPGES_03380, partial [Coraliomargarita sp.]